MRRSAAALLAVMALAGPARADHSEDEHITDEMPYTLRPDEWLDLTYTHGTPEGRS